MGVPAEKSGRNDILVEGAKISGNAYYHNKFGTVCHGTLLFNTDLTVLARALNPKPKKRLLTVISGIILALCLVIVVSLKYFYL